MNRNRAVMEARAPKDTQDEDPVRAKWRAPDYFATPPWATRAGAEIVRECFPAAALIWEPACGDGIMAAVLRETWGSVISSDVYDHGAGRPTADFIRTPWHADMADVVITNPPFEHAVEFVRVGLEVARLVAVLCRTAFIEGAERFELHNAHLSRFCPFAERVTMTLGPWDPDARVIGKDGKERKQSTATSYAWFIFSRMPLSVRPGVQIIRPGTRARLTRDDDVRRFVKQKRSPLFETIAEESRLGV